MSDKKPNALKRAVGNVTATVAINRAAAELAAWLDRENVTPSQLETWAADNKPVIVQLLATVTEGAGWARQAFGSVARSFTDQHIWEVVRTLAGPKPEHAAVLADARYWPWFLSQMRDAQKWLSGS